MLCQFQVYSKVNQLYIYIYPLFFRLFSHTHHYRVLSRVPCAIQQVLIRSFLFQPLSFAVVCFAAIDSQNSHLRASLGGLLALPKLHLQVSSQNFRSSFRVSFSFLCSSSFPLTPFSSVLLLSPIAQLIFQPSVFLLEEYSYINFLKTQFSSCFFQNQYFCQYLEQM